MLTGKELGAALKEAMALKGVNQLDVAKEFNVKQPSVSEWTKLGRISKKHIPHLVSYFSDKVGPEHWGLPADWTVTTWDFQIVDQARYMALKPELKAYAQAAMMRAILECETGRITEKPELSDSATRIADAFDKAFATAAARKINKEAVEATILNGLARIRRGDPPAWLQEEANSQSPKQVPEKNQRTQPAKHLSAPDSRSTDRQK